MNSGTFNSVWDAIEDSPEVAENMKLRSKLMIDIRELIDEHQWSKAESARQLGMTQPRLNDLLQGKIDNFSLDALVIAAAHAGLTIEIQIKHAA
jgi:predicted XRE-type DNA-binding protein